MNARLRELLARAGVESGAPFEAFAGEVLGRDGDCLLGCYSNAAHGYDARSTADLIAATLNALPALLHQLAEIRDDLASLQVINNALRRDHERSKARAEYATEAIALLRRLNDASYWSCGECLLDPEDREDIAAASGGKAQ